MKALTTTIFLVFATVFNASAQLDVTVNPIFSILESYQISVEHTIKDSWSVGLDGSFGKELYGNKASNYAFLTGRHYFFPTKKSDRLYVSIFAGVANATTYKYYYNAITGVSYSTEQNFETLGYGFGAGYKFISNKGIVFDVAAGVGRSAYVFPHFKINLGYRFNYKTS